MANELSFTFPVNELAAALAEKLAPLFEGTKPQETQQGQKYLTRKQTAELLRVSLPTLNEYTKKGKINACRFGVRVLYNQNEIEAGLLKTSTGRAAHG